ALAGCALRGDGAGRLLAGLGTATGGADPTAAESEGSERRREASSAGAAGERPSLLQPGAESAAGCAGAGADVGSDSGLEGAEGPRYSVQGCAEERSRASAGAVAAAAESASGSGEGEGQPAAPVCDGIVQHDRRRWTERGGRRGADVYRRAAVVRGAGSGARGEKRTAE